MRKNKPFPKIRIVCPKCSEKIVLKTSQEEMDNLEEGDKVLAIAQVIDEKNMGWKYLAGSAWSDIVKILPTPDRKISYQERIFMELWKWLMKMV